MGKTLFFIGKSNGVYFAIKFNYAIEIGVGYCNFFGKSIGIAVGPFSFWYGWR